jgi:hypothetical protein
MSGTIKPKNPSRMLAGIRVERIWVKSRFVNLFNIKDND